jgi:hypothetical protein
VYHRGIHQMLTIGTRLGPYEIQAAIGAGGMREVYGGVKSSVAIP